MKTLERPSERVHTRDGGGGRRNWRVVSLAAALALVVGGVVGWMIRSDDSGDVLLAGDGTLTDRQEQIADFMDDYEQAWIDGDIEALTSMYAPAGRFIAFDTIYRADDDLAEFVEDGWAIDVHRPVLVRGNEVLSFHDWGDSFYVNEMTFTATGDLLLIEHRVLD